MAIELLHNASAGDATPAGPYTRTPDGTGYVDVHSCGRNPVSIRLLVSGTFTAGKVIFENSPNSGVDWFQLGAGASGDEIHVERPVDWVRARCDAAVAGGTANAYMEVSA